jgi:hypothetical protein
MHLRVQGDAGRFEMVHTRRPMPGQMPLPQDAFVGDDAIHERVCRWLAMLNS